LMTALSGGLSLSRNFKVLKGLSFSYSGRFSKYLHRYTTWERESSLIPACPAGDTGCDAFLNTGVRNSNMRHSHSFSAGVGILSWLSFSTSFGLIYDHLYDSTGDEGTSFTPQEPQDTRYLMQHGLALSFKPMASMGIVLGVNTTWPQLASDSTYRTPLYNRYSVIYLDLKLDVAGLVSQLTPNEEKHVSN